MLRDDTEAIIRWRCFWQLAIQRCGIFVLALLIGLASGCGKEEPAKKDMGGEYHVLQIWHLHTFFWEETKRTPTDVDELKTWASDLSNLRYSLKELGMKSIEDAFVSPRDGQPYILQKITPKQMEQMAKGQVPTDVILSYEAVGANGKRFASLLRGGHKEFPESFFKE